MLKFENVNMIDGLTAEEAAAPGFVTVKIVSTEVAHGMCQFKLDGMNTVALIQAAGNTGVNTPFEPADITVEVVKVLNREAAVKKGDTSINTGLGDAVTAAKLDGTDVEAADLSHGVITIDEAAKDEVHELELTVLVGTGAASDANVAGKVLVLDAVPFQISAIAEAKHAPGQKHSKTNCTIRGRKPWKVTGEDGPLHMAPLGD